MKKTIIQHALEKGAKGVKLPKIDPRPFHKLIYKNHFGDVNILVTSTSNGKFPSRETYIPVIEVYHAHLWIHDNIVKKNHTSIEKFEIGSEISNDELKDLLGFKINEA